MCSELGFFLRVNCVAYGVLQLVRHIGCYPNAAWRRRATFTRWRKQFATWSLFSKATVSRPQNNKTFVEIRVLTQASWPLSKIYPTSVSARLTANDFHSSTQTQNATRCALRGIEILVIILFLLDKISTAPLTQTNPKPFTIFTRVWLVFAQKLWQSSLDLFLTARNDKF